MHNIIKFFANLFPKPCTADVMAGFHAQIRKLENIEAQRINAAKAHTARREALLDQADAAFKEGSDEYDEAARADRMATKLREFVG